MTAFSNSQLFHIYKTLDVLLDNSDPTQNNVGSTWQKTYTDKQMYAQEPHSWTSTSLSYTRVSTTSPPIVNEKLLTTMESPAGPRGSTADNVDPTGPIDILGPTRPIGSLDQESTSPIHPPEQHQTQTNKKMHHTQQIQTQNQTRTAS